MSCFAFFLHFSCCCCNRRPISLYGSLQSGSTASLLPCADLALAICQDNFSFVLIDCLTDVSRKLIGPNFRLLWKTYRSKFRGLDRFLLVSNGLISWKLVLLLKSSALNCKPFHILFKGNCPKKSVRLVQLLQKSIFQRQFALYAPCLHLQ